MMKLKFKLTLLLLTLCTLAHAEEHLVLYNSDGTKIEFALSTNPVITLQDGTLLVKSTATEFSIAIENVQNFVLYDNTTDINIIEESEAKPFISDGHVVFSQLKAGSKVYVYSTNGQQLLSFTADNSGRIDIFISSLPKGICILRSPTNSIKITN